MSSSGHENAACRTNFASEIYRLGVQKQKDHILKNVLEPESAALHTSGAIHIHDLEGYGLVNNCSSPSVRSFIRPPSILQASSIPALQIAEVFERYKELITRLATVQNGGIGFAEFDRNVSELLSAIELPYTAEHIAYLADAMRGFVRWLNTSRTRFCRELYFVHVHVGLSTTQWGREVTRSLLAAFSAQPMSHMQPNIVFKVRDSLHREGRTNRDLYLQALACTAKRMIPTFLLCDSPANAHCDPDTLGISGCRSRVDQNENGKHGAVGRGNAAYVTMNLPRLALESTGRADFFERLSVRLDQVRRVLDHRADLLVANAAPHHRLLYTLWDDVTTIPELVRSATHSLGFLGLAEAVELLLPGQRYHGEGEARELGLSIVRAIRGYADEQRAARGRNYSVLASAGEYISGKFAECCQAIHPHPVNKKGFYTNSFHVAVDSGLSIFEKLRIEAPYHQLCNGGSITYVGFSEAPLSNLLALEQAMQYAQRKGVSYLGFNFPLDVCRRCNTHGTFDACPVCPDAESSVLRIRRVTGYLGAVEFFTAGKKAEVKQRRPDCLQE